MTITTVVEPCQHVPTNFLLQSDIFNYGFRQKSRANLSNLKFRQQFNASSGDYSMSSTESKGCKGAASAEYTGCASQKIGTKVSECDYKADSTHSTRAGITSRGASCVVGMLRTIREPIADYQEKRGGLPKDEQSTFWNLLKSLCEHSYNAVITIFVMLYNLFPLLEGFLLLIRFALDKLIDISESGSRKEMVFKALLLIGQMAIIIVLVVIICGLIVYPVFQLSSHIVCKAWSFIYPSSAG